MRKRRGIAMLGLAGTLCLCIFPPVGRTIGPEFVFDGFAPIWKNAGMIDPVRFGVLILAWWCVAGLVTLIRKR